MEKKKNGFLLLWVLCAVVIASILGGTAFVAISAALRMEKDAEIKADETMIVQEAMEKIKYESMFSVTSTMSTGEYVRNGRKYNLSIKRNEVNLQGVPLSQVVCEASAETGTSYHITALVRRKKENEEQRVYSD